MHSSPVLAVFQEGLRNGHPCTYLVVLCPSLVLLSSKASLIKSCQSVQNLGDERFRREKNGAMANRSVWN